ncbi:MAG: [LysW]-lysine hydrolase [Chloroflexota bacterium]
MSQTESAVRAALSESEIENLLCNLVAVASPSRGENDAARLLVDWMVRHSYQQAFVDEVGNAVGILGSGSRDVVLLGHIDTFGGNFPVQRDGNLLYGRGAVDAKGALCTFAAAALQAQLPPDVRLIVIGAVEEEAASSKGARFAATQYQPELCVIGEPSQWDRITLGYKGRLLIEWNWHGDLGHSAGQTATAGELAFCYWQGVLAYVNEFNIERQRIFERLDATLQEIQTGHDGVHGWGRLVGGFRLPPDVVPDSLAEHLSHHLDDGVTVRAFGHERAYVAERDSAVSRALRGAIRAEGGQPAFVHKTGTSDMNIVGRIWNCPVVAYGPGDSALDHTPNEHIDLNEYLRAVRVLTRALERL